VDVAALEVDRGACDVVVEPRDLITLRGEAVRSSERALGIVELPEPRVGHREEPGEDRGRERVRASLECLQCFVQELGTLSELAREHHARAHEGFGNGVRRRIAERYPDLLGLLDGVLQLWAR